MIELVNAVVLRSEELGEYDKRLTIYTKELGKLKAKIVGVKKIQSKLKVLTIPFAELRLQVYLHGTKRAGLHLPGKIVGGEIVHSHASLRTQWDKMVQSSTFCEILDVLTHPLYPNAREYELLASTLSNMEQSPMPLLVRLRSTLILLRILGYSLRYHPTWKKFSEEEKKLLNHLAKWNMQTEMFNKEETVQLKSITENYLSNYLPHPLKTAIFQQKMNNLENLVSN